MAGMDWRQCKPTHAHGMDMQGENKAKNPIGWWTWQWAEKFSQQRSKYVGG